jgi:hypothetical protein
VETFKTAFETILNLIQNMIEICGYETGNHTPKRLGCR